MQIMIMAIPLYLANRSLTFKDFSEDSDNTIFKENDIKPSNIKTPSVKVYQEAKKLLKD
jgi:hypothetical protein